MEEHTAYKMYRRGIKEHNCEKKRPYHHKIYCNFSFWKGIFQNLFVTLNLFGHDALISPANRYTWLNLDNQLLILGLRSRCVLFLVGMDAKVSLHQFSLRKFGAFFNFSSQVHYFLHSRRNQTEAEISTNNMVTFANIKCLTIKYTPWLISVKKFTINQSALKQVFLR